MSILRRIGTPLMLFACLILLVGCRTPAQKTYIELKRIEAVTEMNRRPIWEGENVTADNIKVYAPAVPLDPPTDELKEFKEMFLGTLKIGLGFLLGKQVIKGLTKSRSTTTTTTTTTNGGY